MRLDERSYTPDLLRRILTLAGLLKSFELAAVALHVAADVPITGRHVQRLTQEVGADLRGNATSRPPNTAAGT